MKKKKGKTSIKFILIVISSLLVTVYFANIWGNILFGDNSMLVYDSLRNKKIYFENEIIRLQKENAYLQKEYFELKNLEPEE